MSGQSDGHETQPGRTQAHLADFFGRGEAFARQLIAENERLRREVAGEADATSVPSSGVVEELLAKVEELEAKGGDGAPSEASVRELREARERSAALATEVTDLKESLERLEGENYHLATLYIVIQQLHSARVLGDVLQTLTEVCLNFIGVGSFSLYGIDEDRQLAFPLLREGAPFDELEERPLADEGPIAAIAGLGRPWQGGDPVPHEFGVLMYLPLVSGERLVGVITLEAYLPQKSALSDEDFAVLAMISEHGGIGLEKVWVRAHAAAAPLTRRALEALLDE